VITVCIKKLKLRKLYGKKAWSKIGKKYPHLKSAVGSGGVRIIKK